ncbi:AAA family ATPase [Thiolinea disciformis]|uniref:AAA family ATPase n=1 Tax=Thiolinea disciformis TaxID=125614 RepID=UPI0003812E53|nr:AAA family ATPase [Thiolinea disciformis]
MPKQIEPKMPLKIPYGVSNFKKVRSEGFVYIDKTNYIAALEQAGEHLILLRPRRFGKSLFLSMLEHYYDTQYVDDFETLFADLHVGQHPTPLKNSYPILFMEFSGIETEQGYESVYQGFNHEVKNALKRFLTRYGYSPESLATMDVDSSPQGKMKDFLRIIEDQKVLLLIDEYDHFANSLLGNDLNLFQSIVGKGGFVRSFYETIKTGTQRGIIDRLFITGVTPIMLDSMTSGFNIGKNLSLTEVFNEVIGFNRVEVEGLLSSIANTCPTLDQNTLYDDVRRWYNGYRFHLNAPEAMYNSDMVLYFVDRFDYKRCAYPEYMLDENIASDYGKIMAMFSIGDRDTNYTVLEELLNQGEVSARYQRKFDFDKGFDRDDFVSLLAYMGFISLQRKTLSGDIFTIPNYVMRELYFQYFKVEVERRNHITISDRAILLAVETLALDNNIQPLMIELEQVLKLLSNRDSIWMDEQHIKTILLTLLYQSSAYFIHSEREMNRRYPDILLLERSPFKVNYQHLIELKYSKKSEGEKGWMQKKLEGIEQVKGYLQLPTIAALQQLSAWLVIADGERVEWVNVVG